MPITEDFAAAREHYYRLWGWRGRRPTKQRNIDSQEEWKVVEDAALKYWDEIAAKNPTNAKVVEISKITPRQWRPPARLRY